MAHFRYSGGPTGSFDLLANWRNSNASYQDLGPASAFPGPGDIAYLPTDAGGTLTATGTCYAGEVQAVSTMGPPPVIGGGTYQGIVRCALGVSGGVFNGDVYVDGNNMGPYGLSGGTFNGSVRVNMYVGILWSAALVINGRLSLDYGASWLYSPNSPAVAPASSVQQGVSNLGTVGTLVAGAAAATRVIGTLGVA